MIKKYKVLISGICGNSYGAQVAKSLSLLEDYELFGADANPSGLCEAFKIEKLLKFPRASSEVYLDSLFSFYQDYKIDYYIEGSEAEQIVLNQHRSFLEHHKIHWVSNNKAAIDICLDKRKLAHFLKENEVFAPHVFAFKDLQENQSLFPVILKPYSQSGGSKDVYIAQDLEDINAILYLSKRKMEDYIIQQYIGTPEAEYTVGILHNNKGVFIGSATLQRDLSQSLSLRSVSQNITSKHALGERLVISSGFSQGRLHHNPKIEYYCRTIAEKMKSSGPLNFQGRLVDNKFHIFEINPRFSGTSFMRALSGFNEADLWIKNLDKENVISPFYLNSNIVYKRVIKEIKECRDYV
jgi:carbamoyl-phosphate synthase large subunit